MGNVTRMPVIVSHVNAARNTRSLTEQMVFCIY